MAIISLEGISYGYNRSSLILRDLQVDFLEGETSVIVGANGSGKSTLAKLLLGLIRPSSGRCVRASGIEAAGRTTAVYQDVMASLLPWLSAVGNVALPLRCLGQRKVVAEEAAAKALKSYAVAFDASALVTRISGGQRQMVAWVRAFITEPRFVVLDEPFSALDVSRIARLSNDLLQRVGQGLSAVLIVHDLDQALLVADRVIVLPSGRDGRWADFRVDLPKPRTAEDIAAAAELRKRLLEAIWRQA